MVWQLGHSTGLKNHDTFPRVIICCGKASIKHRLSFKSVCPMAAVFLPGPLLLHLLLPFLPAFPATLRRVLILFHQKKRLVSFGEREFLATVHADDYVIRHFAIPKS